MIRDYFRNTLCCNAKRVVSLTESIENGKVWIDFSEAFVVDNQ